ncbi:MAG TPA: sulfatase-like hydrolase/transferase, partial [Candidatus Nitrosotenuis sp.]|nr:sulfatase-like hydrolase/transferase [Candidatus Nitrosotenuis sp.]
MNSNFSSTEATIRSTLLTALWFGVLGGLLSACAVLLFQQLGWLNWDVARYGVNWQILWVEPFFNTIIFLLVGFFIAVGQLWLPRLRAWHTAIFVFAFLTALNWLFVSGRIKQSACVILALGIAAAFHRSMRPRAERLYALQARTIPPLLVGTLLLAGLLFGIAYLREQQQIAALPPAPPGRPNVVLIVMDTVRADHLSAYGYSRQTSPFLDRLAKEGVLFESAVSTSSWTLPSHASLVTGQYVHQHGAESSRFVPGATTLPLEFQKHGYRTAAISANQAWFTTLHGFGKGFSRFEDFFFSWRDRFARTVWGRKFQKLVWSRFQEYSLVRRFGEDVTTSALDWCEKDSGRPFFLFLNYFDAHPPYLPPRPWRGKFISSAEGPGRIGDAAEVGVRKLSPEELAAEIGGYDGGIAYMDEQIRRLVEGLRERGQLQNTI